MSDILLLQIPNINEPMYMIGMATIKSYFQKKYPDISIKIIDPAVEYFDKIDWKINEKFLNKFNTFIAQGNLEYLEKEPEIYQIVGFLLNNIKKENPKIIGFSIIDGNIDATLVICKKIKKLCPDLKVVIGGIGTEMMEGGLLPTEDYSFDSYKFLDYVVFGDGEQTLSELYFSDQSFDSLSKIKGLKFKHNGEWVDNEKFFPGQSDSIKEASLLSYEDIEENTYYKKSYGDSVPLVLSRGCPYRCTFCSVPFFIPKFQHRPFENVFEEMEYWINKGKKDFFIHDSIVNGNPVLLEEFCNEIIDKGWGDEIIWGANFRLQKPMRDMKTIELYHKSGMNRMITGLETASPVVAKHMKKYSSTNGIRDIFDNLRKMNEDKSEEFFGPTKKIRVWLQLIIGYPIESDEDFQMTYDFVEEYSDVVEWILTCSAFLLWPPLLKQWKNEGRWIDFKNGVEWETEYNTIDQRMDRFNRIEKLFIDKKLKYNVYHRGLESHSNRRSFEESSGI